jgi:hypothetical protein
MKDKARAQANRNLQDRTVSIMSSDAPWRIVYGEAVVGGTLGAILTSGGKDQYKHVPMIWAAHECHSIEDILIKGSSIGALDGSGNVTGGTWASGSPKLANQNVTFNGAGAAALTHAPTAVLSVSVQTATIDSDGRATVVDDLQAIGSLVITGNTIQQASLAGLSAVVNYRYTPTATPRVRVHHHLGSATQTADAVLLAEVPADWSASDRLRGLCHSIIRYDLNEAEFQAGPPQATARVKGCKVYDPRTGLTAWSSNPALCTAHFLMAEWGKRALFAQINWPSVAAAANACDELLTNGQKRYTCNGSFDTDADVDATLNELCQSMAGFAVFNGTWTLQAGVYTAPVMALTDDDCAGSIEVLGGPTGQEVFNGLRGRFYDPARFDQRTDYTPYRNAAFVAEDGGALWGDLPLPFTNADWRCQNLARIQVERSRGMQLVFPAKNSARALRAGQRVTLTNAFLGLNADVFRVVKKERRLGQPTLLTLAQDDASMYDETDAPASLSSPSSFAVNPFKVDAVTGLAVVSDITVAQWNLDGTVIGNTYVSWDASTDALVQTLGAMQVEYRAAEASEWTRAPEAPGDSTGMLLPRLPERQLFFVAARWRNSLGVVGEWRYAHVLTERLPAPRTGASLVDATWWAPGAAWPWRRNETNVGENSIVYGIGPRDLQQALWKCVAAGTPGADRDGGWEEGELSSTPSNAFVVNPARAYRFAVPFMRSAGTGEVYWGPGWGWNQVCNLNTSTPASNPYFAFWSGMAANRWYLAVGYIFPAGSTGLTNAGAGIYDMETGALVQAGTNFCWAAGATECSTRAYQFYASTGATISFAPPVVEMLDGYDSGRVTYIGEKQVTEGATVAAATSVGSTGSPGSSVRVTTMYGPGIECIATDELQIDVAGVLRETFWSQALYAKVELWMTTSTTYLGTQTEIGGGALRRKFMMPVDVYTATTIFPLDFTMQLAPGAGTLWYHLRVQITYINAAGSTVQCGKDYTADAEFRIFKRKH